MPGSGSLVVIGHKNPDTDSICSAIAYARYKSTVDGTPAEAFRAGNINAQTSFALEHFGAPVPPLLSDLHPRLRDIMIPREQLFVISPDEPLSTAKDIILKNRFTFLPVAGTDGTCSRKITALRLVEIMDDIAGVCRKDSVRIDVNRFLALCGSPTDKTRRQHLRGRLVLDLGCIDLEPDDFADSIVVTSEHDLESVLPYRPTAVVVTSDGSSTADHAVSTRGGTTIVRVAVGAAQAAVNLCYAMPSGAFAEDAHPVFRDSDRVQDVATEINKYNDGGFIVTDSAGKITGVVTRMSFLTEARFRVVMVDHNEYSQAVDGIEHADVAEVIDHHRLGGPNTTQPITFINRVVGSTCTIVADLYRQRGVRPDPMIAGLLLAGIVSDTVILKSPTTADLDTQIVEWLAPIAGLDVHEFGHAMFVAGSGIEDVSDDEIVTRDQKSYTESGRSFSVSQVEMIGFREFWRRKDAIIEALDRFVEKKGLEFAALMVTDITTETTLLAYAGSPRVKELIRYPALKPDVFEMKRVVSRKKQLLPYLIEIVRSTR